VACTFAIHGAQFRIMKWTKLFSGFFESEKIGGVLLLICTIVSLLIANSGFGETYTHFWHTKLDLSFAGLNLNYSIEHWINDGRWIDDDLFFARWTGD
jgi:Na+:H+ antiporter, NhaA family